MKRPLLLVALFYVSGILIASYIPAPLWLLLSCSLCLAAVALVWSEVRLVLLYALCLLTGWTNSALHTAILSPQDLRCALGDRPELATVRGMLREAPVQRVLELGERESWRTLARIEVTGLRLNQKAWQPATGCLAVSTRGLLSTNFFAGQTVELTGVLAPPKTAFAEGTFDYRAYLSEQGIYYHLEAESERDWRILASPRAPPLADRFRAWARQALAVGLPGEDETLRLEWALTLGWKTALTEHVSEPFIRAATYHIFAVDGLRMAIIFGIGFVLLRVLRVPRAAGGLVLLPVIWFYTALTGWPASAIRATVMLSVVIMGWVLNRPSDLLNSLFAAALIILLWQPRQLFQAGFQLSFLVVLCIILTMPVLKQLGERLVAPDPLLPDELRPGWQRAFRLPGRFIGDLLLTSFAAWIGSVPLVAYYFNVVTPVSTPANIIAVPLCALVLISNFASLLLAGWFPLLADVFNSAGWFLMECIRVSSHWFATWPGAYFNASAPSLFAIVLYYAILLAALTGWLFKPGWRCGKFAVLAIAVSCWAWCGWREHAVTRLTILPVNGGISIYFDAPGGKGDLLVDCGNTNSVEFLLKPFLRARGVNRLPALALTHGDLRHVGGAALLTNLFKVETVCASAVRFRSPVYRRFLDDLKAKPGRWRAINLGDRLGAWAVLHPDAGDHFSQADDNALVLLATISGTRVLLLSDLGKPGQKALLGRYPELRTDILVTGLPVQTEAVCDALLDAVQPQVIIVVDSEFPVVERASPKLCERLGHRGVPVVYTRTAGVATVEWRSRECQIRTRVGPSLTSQGPNWRFVPPPGQ